MQTYGRFATSFALINQQVCLSLNMRNSKKNKSDMNRRRCNKDKEEEQEQGVQVGQGGKRDFQQ